VLEGGATDIQRQRGAARGLFDQADDLGDEMFVTPVSTHQFSLPKALLQGVQQRFWIIAQQDRDHAGGTAGHQAAVAEYRDRATQRTGQLQSNQLTVFQLDLVKLVVAAIVVVDAAARGDLAGHRFVEIEGRGLARIRAAADAVATAGDEGRGNGQSHCCQTHVVSPWPSMYAPRTGLACGRRQRYRQKQTPA